MQATQLVPNLGHTTATGEVSKHFFVGHAKPKRRALRRNFSATKRMAPDWRFLSPDILDDVAIQKIISEVAKRESKLIRHRQAQERYRERLRNSRLQELKLIVCLLSKIQKNCQEISVLRKGNREYRKKLSLIRRLVLDYSGALEGTLHDPNLQNFAANKLGDIVVDRWIHKKCLQMPCCNQ